MKKQKNDFNLFLLFVLIIFLLVFLTIEVINLEIRISKLPKRVCHNETETTKIEILPFLSCGNKSVQDNSIYWRQNPPQNCRVYRYEAPEGADYKCEDGITVYPYSRQVINYGKEVKVCLSTTTKEVCEIR